MVVFAANITDETAELLDHVLKTDEFVKFSLQNKLNLNDKTIYLRLCMINLANHMPSNEEVTQYKAALLRPQEFDDYWKHWLGRINNAR